jgi:predicted DNA-binding protein
MITTHSLQINETPYRQFPLRLPHEMANELDRIAKRTRINKTTISHIAIQKFMSEVERSGADALVNDLCEV